MAEAIAISLSAKLAMALSGIAVAGLSPLFGVRSEIAATVQDLDLLRAFLRIVDSRRGTDALAAEWVQQVRDAAFELEDVADECCYLSGHGRGWVNVRAWFALSRRLRKARERLRQLSAAKEQYGISQADGPPPTVATASQFVAQTAHFLEKEEIVGFAAHEKQLMEWVTGNMEPRRTALVAVWGMGGVGKTTLVTRVYKEVAASRRHFECAAWVAISQAFTLEDLLRKILKELSGDASASGGRDADADYRSLVSAVHGILQQRRYLVVLDDVWDAQLWVKLRHAFLDDANGSRVLITTRNRDVAKAAAPERTMMLEPLQWRDAWNLFCNVAFWDVPGRTCPSHLEELATDMLGRCCGLPLAIVSIGNLLARKDRTEYEWQKTRDSLVWNECSEDLGIGEAASILNLSIDDLPHNIKRCFLSCSVYPEDFLLKRKIHIRMWVAQGFIEEKPGQHRTAEEIADDYLDQLVQRSLLQAVDRNEFGRPKSCVIHDLMRELIIHKSREQEGFFQLAHCKVAMNRNNRIRHLAVGMCEEVDSQHIQSLATLRSFIGLGSNLDASFLSRFRLLTVLNLWLIRISKLPDSVTNLFNLRYLGIRSTPIQQLPNELGKLQKLQTLDAKWSMVRMLPSSAAKLKSLRHLIIFASPGIAVQIPDGLENMCSLQTLKYVRADNKKMVRSLAKLEQMRSLELFDVNLSCIEDLSFSISKMSSLLRLGLRCEPGSDEALDLKPICPPPLKLKILSLNGIKLPSWTGSLTSLVHLWLCDSRIAHDSLADLAKLPSLVSVTLITAYQGTSMTFAGGSFPALQRLILEDIPNLSRIEFNEGCLQNLRHLVLIRCRRLTETPQGMDNLTRLKHLNLIDMPEHFVNSLKQQDGHAAYYKPDNSEFLRLYAPRPWRWIGPNKKEVAKDMVSVLKASPRRRRRLSVQVYTARLGKQGVPSTRLDA